MGAMPFMWARWLCQFAQTSAAVLLAGTAVLRLLAWGTGMERCPGWNRLAWASWAVLLGAALLQLGLTAADMSGLPVAQACTRPVLGSVLGSTAFGAVWKVRAYLLVVTFAVGWFIDGAQRRDARTSASAIFEIAGALLAAALLATLVWSGHARASDQHAWLLPADLLHAMAAGAWPGGLLPLALLLRHARRNPNLLAPALRVTRRFSRLSVAAVSLLVLGGLLNSIGLVGTLSALWESVYGRLILCKVALLAGMVGFGALNRRMIRQVDASSAPQVLRLLWRTVAWETVLAVCVLLATEALALSAPPASERGDAPMRQPFSKRLHLRAPQAGGSRGPGAMANLQPRGGSDSPSALDHFANRCKWFDLSRKARQDDRVPSRPPMQTAEPTTQDGHRL